MGALLFVLGILTTSLVLLIAVKHHQAKKDMVHSFILELLVACNNAAATAPRHAVTIDSNESLVRAEFRTPQFTCAYMWPTDPALTHNNEPWLQRTIEGEILFEMRKSYHLADHLLLFNLDAHKVVFLLTESMKTDAKQNRYGISYELSVFEKSGHQIISKQGVYEPISNECRCLFNKTFQMLNTRINLS